MYVSVESDRLVSELPDEFESKKGPPKDRPKEGTLEPHMKTGSFSGICGCCSSHGCRPCFPKSQFKYETDYRILRGMTGGKNMIHKNIKITITVPTHYPENDSHADQSAPKREKTFSHIQLSKKHMY